MSVIIRTTGAEDFLDGGTAHIKALIMGAPSAGKTRSASFWPKPIFADCEKGRMSIADRRVPYAEIITSEDMDDLLARLRRECFKPPQERLYQTLVIDTLDAYQRIVIKERLDAERKDSLSGWADWGYLDGKLTGFIAKLHALPMNIVVNVHVKDNTQGEGDDKITTVGVKLKGDIKDQIAADFDLVGYMGTYWEAVDGERKLLRGIQWHPDPMMPVLKDRSGNLPKWTPVSFTDEDYGTIFGAVTRTMDDLAESTVVEVLDREEAPAPVAPQAGGPIAGAPLTPPSGAKKAAPAKATVPSAPRPAPATPEPAQGAQAIQAARDALAAQRAAQAAKAAESSDTRAAVLGGEPVPTSNSSNSMPTDVGSQPSARASVPSAPRPQIGGASSAPADQAPASESPAAESEPEAAEQPAEPVASEAEAIEAVTEQLGGEVISEPAAVDEPTTTESDQGQVAEVETADDGGNGWPLCGTSSNEGEEGQPGQQPGCGTPVDPDLDVTQIGIFKTRTYLCPTDYEAFKARSKSATANA